MWRTWKACRVLVSKLDCVLMDAGCISPMLEGSQWKHLLFKFLKVWLFRIPNNKNLFPYRIGTLINFTQSPCGSQYSGNCGIFLGTQASKNTHVVEVRGRGKVDWNNKVYFLYSLINAAVPGDDQSYNIGRFFCLVWFSFFVIYCVTSKKLNKYYFYFLVWAFALNLLPPRSLHTLSHCWNTHTL